MKFPSSRAPALRFSAPRAPGAPRRSRRSDFQQWLRGPEPGRPPARPIQALGSVITRQVTSRIARSRLSASPAPPARTPGGCPELSQRAGGWAPTTHPRGLFLSIPFPGAGGARSWAGHSRAGVPPSHPRRAGWKPSNLSAARCPTDWPAMAPRAPPRPSPTVPGSLLASFQLTAKLAPSGRHRVLGGARLAASARPRAGSRSAGRLAGAAALHRVPASGLPALSVRPYSKAAPGGPRARPALPGRPARGISLRSRPRPLAPALVSPARKLSTLLSPGLPDIPQPARPPGPRSLAKGSGSSRPLQRPAPCQDISECPGRSSDTARRKQIALAPRLVMASTHLCKELIWNVPC